MLASPAVLIALLLLLLIFGALAFAQHRARAAGRECAARLGLTNAKVDSESVTGELGGRRVTLTLIPGARSTPPRTKIEVTFEPCELMLELRAQTEREERAVSAGEAIDLSTGDPAFDRAFVVEGAPAPRALAVLADPTLRLQLQGFAQHAEARVTIEDGSVWLHRAGSDLHRGRIDDTHLRLALALADAAVAASRAPVTSAGGWAGSTAAKGVETAKTLSSLKLLRAERQLRTARPWMMLAHAVVPAAALTRAIGAAMEPAPPEPEVQAALFAGFFLPLHATATVLSIIHMRRITKTAPGQSLDAPTMSVMALSWLIALGAIAALSMR